MLLLAREVAGDLHLPVGIVVVSVAVAERVARPGPLEDLGAVEAPDLHLVALTAEHLHRRVAVGEVAHEELVAASRDAPHRVGVVVNHERWRARAHKLVPLVAVDIVNPEPGLGAAGPRAAVVMEGAEDLVVCTDEDDAAVRSCHHQRAIRGPDLRQVKNVTGRCCRGSRQERRRGATCQREQSCNPNVSCHLELPNR